MCLTVTEETLTVQLLYVWLVRYPSVRASTVARFDCLMATAGSSFACNHSFFQIGCCYNLVRYFQLLRQGTVFSLKHWRRSWVKISIVNVFITCLGVALIKALFRKEELSREGGKIKSIHCPSERSLPPLKQSMYLYAVDWSALSKKRNCYQLFHSYPVYRGGRKGRVYTGYFTPRSEKSMKIFHQKFQTYFIFVHYPMKLSKGRTIRKVMGGRGIFEPQEFFSLSNFLHEFFLGHSVNIFQD